MGGALRELHKLAKVFKMLKIKDFDQNKEVINEE